MIQTTGRIVTMADVAALAGVSKATVSKALNRLPVVKASTCARVYKACNELGYRLNPGIQDFLRHRRTGHSQDISFALVDVPFSSSFYAGMIEGISQIVQANRMHLALNSLSGSVFHQYGLPPEIRDRRSAGVLISGNLNTSILALVRETGIPYVVLGNYPMEIAAQASSVSVATENLIDLAVAELKTRGKARIAFFHERPNNYFSTTCYEAFQRALVLHGLPFYEDMVLRGKGGDYNALDVMDAYCASATIDFDAIICLSEMGAREIVCEIIAHGGKEAARGIIMVCIADHIRNTPMPTLYFEDFTLKMGMLGTELLIEKLKSPQRENKHIAFTPNLAAVGFGSSNIGCSISPCPDSHSNT